MTEEIAMCLLSVADLAPHPLQAEIYGGMDLTDEFVDSIRQTGLLQPPVVTPDGDGYRIISGHRRVAALAKLGITEVSCKLRTYENSQEESYDFLASNAARQKTSQSLIKEALALLIITRNNHANEVNPLTILDEACDARTSIDDAIMTQTEMAASIGQSRVFIERVRIVFDEDYRESYLSELREVKITKGSIKAFVKAWDKVRNDVYDGRINLFAAAEEIRAARKRANAGADEYNKIKKQKEEKKKRKAATSTSQHLAIPTGIDAALNWLLDRDIDQGKLCAITVDGSPVPESWLPTLLVEYAEAR